ncbi:MAG TPA: helix-turn-helix transcriptional regulator [Vicinamibacterales bacterium]|nr:helix-turn-helix transcriptional regulator [Vicinamibacterales bacterium]
MTLKPASFYILLALADRSRHGYGIMQAVRERSSGSVTVRTASFYRHLARLIEAGLVAESADRPDDDDPRRGAYYDLTPAGRAALDAERARLEDLLAAADTWAPGRGERR